MQQHPLPTAEQTFERSLTGVEGTVMRWAITSEDPYPGAARLDYTEARDGTVTITGMVVHPSASRRGLQRAVLAALAAHHPSLLWWRLAPTLARAATHRSATFWARAASDHTVFLADEHGVAIKVRA